MNNVICAIVACVVLLAGGPFKNSEADKKVAFEKGKRLVLKADAPDGVKAAMAALDNSRPEYVAFLERLLIRSKQDLAECKKATVNKYFGGSSNREFSTKESKDAEVKRLGDKVEFCKDQLAGVKAGTIYDLLPIKTYSVGAVGTLRCLEVVRVVDENSVVVNVVNSQLELFYQAEEKKQANLLLTGVDTKSLVAESKIGPLQVEVVGKRNDSSTEYTELRTFSIYDFLEPKTTLLKKKTPANPSPK